jgi:thiamine biosynthesis lipoprotein
MISTHDRTSFLICLVLLSALAACGDQRATEYQLSGPTMGTRFSVVVVTELAFDQQHLQAQIYAALEDVEQRMSTYRGNSEVSQFNHSSSTDWTPVSRQLCEAVAQSFIIDRLDAGIAAIVRSRR